MFVAEFPHQIDGLRQRSASLQVFATNPRMVQLLRQAGLSPSDARELYRHEELWSRYQATNAISDSLCAVLDHQLRLHDVRFVDRDLNLFQILNFPIKIVSDQIYYFTLIFSRLLERCAGGDIECVRSETLMFDDSALMRSDQSIASHVIEMLATRYRVRVHHPEGRVGENAGTDDQALTAFSFGQPRFIPPVRNGVRQLAGNFVRALRYRRPTAVNATILSIFCKELEAVADDLALHGLAIKRFSYDPGPIAPGPGRYAATEAIMAAISANEELRRIVAADGISYLDLIAPQIRLILGQADRIIAIHDECMKKFAELGTDMGIVQTLSPLHIPNAMLLKYCETRGLPFACWMHGGYGAYASLPGYDVTDFRFCRRHIVYGQAVLDSLRATESHTGAKDRPVPVVSCTAGSPFFAKMYDRAPARPAKGPRPRVLLAIGNYFSYNQFYFGYDRPYAEFCNFDCHLAIIDVLCDFVDRYDVVVKDYPSNNLADVWRAAIERRGVDIPVITNERRFHEVASEADIAIFTWVSTTFMESLFTRADMLLFDDSRLTGEARSVLADSILFESDLSTFTARLREYLESGELGQQDKTAVRRYFTGEGVDAGIAKLVPYLYAALAEGPRIS